MDTEGRLLTMRIASRLVLRIEGVANVDIRGIRNKVLTVYLKPEVFYSSSIRIGDLINTIRNNNINISAGYVEESANPDYKGWVDIYKRLTRWELELEKSSDESMITECSLRGKSHFAKR